RLLVKVSLGNFSTSKKSGLLRWPSRVGSWVLMLVTSISALTEDLAKSSSTEMVPVKTPKLPRTLAIIMWRTEKFTPECEGSMFQVWVDIVASEGGPEVGPANGRIDNPMAFISQVAF